MRMKKVLLPLISLALMGSVALNANAETKSPYTVDFNTAINTSDHGFKVASNWRHRVHKYNDGYSDSYMTYTYYADKGVDGSGTLYAGEQKAGDYWDNDITYDFLITPPVSGEISIKVKRNYSSSAFVQFWSVVENEDGTFSKGNKIADITSDLSQEEWKTLTYTVADDTIRIGIRAQYAYLDDFSATSAEIEPEKGLMIDYISPNPQYGTMYWDTQADGFTSKDFKVILENIGDVAINPGDEGYSISLTKSWDNDAVIYTMPIDVALAKGAKSDTIIFTPKFIPTDVWGSSTYRQFNVKENISGSTVKLQQAVCNKYEHKFIFRPKGATSTLTGNPDPFNFEMVSEPDTIVYEIYNDGSAPLNISSIAISEGFVIADAPTGALVVEGKKKKDLAIVITDAPGAHDGSLVITYSDNDGSEKTRTLNLSGLVIAEGVWGTTFNAGKSDPAYPEGSAVENGISNAYNRMSGPLAYDNYLYASDNKNILGQNKFITPKLHAKAGDTFNFGVSRRGSNSDDPGFVKVYVTKDRYALGEPAITLNATDYEYNECKKFTAKSVTIPSEGDYYVVFELYNMAIDNLFGLSKVAVAHDMYTMSFGLRYGVADTIQSGVAFYPETRIIPLTSASKADYALKYYLEKADGTKVAKELPSVNLTAASKGGTSFSGYSITHEVEATTEFTTYFAFEYTDGTVLTTPTRPLVITNEPKFHFIDKSTSTQNEPSDRDKAISFGKTSEFGKKLEFDIFNWGTAPLTVKSVTVPDAFATNIEGQTIVEGKAKLPLEITFVASEVGIYQGNLTIVYVGADGSDKTFELPVSATMLDPEKWYASFQKPNASGSGFEVQWPDGSLREISIQSTYNYSSGEFDIISYSNTDNLFITPKLTAAAGETFSFDARGNNSSVESVLKVVAAKTREALKDSTARIELITLTNKDDEPAETKLITDQHQTFTVTFAEAGDYYIGFFLGNASAIDDLYGLTLTPVDADIKIVSSSIPANAMQNVTSTVSISLLNLGYKGISAKDYGFKLHVGDQVTDIAATDSLPVAYIATEKPVSVRTSIRSPKAGTFPVFMEVVCGDFSASTDTVDVTFAPEVALSEKVVGKYKNTSSCPAMLSYNYSESVILYSAEKLGLNAGDKISSMTFKGTGTSDITTSIEVYYEWTDDQTQTQPKDGRYPIEGMTQYFKGEYNWPKFSTSDGAGALYTLSFAEPLVYEEGKALRIVFYSGDPSPRWAPGYNFEVDEDRSCTFKHQNDNKSSFESNSWNTELMPLLYLGIPLEPTTVSGKVSDPKGVAVEGATVTLVSTDGDNIQYEGTTDAEGKYSINVIQDTRHYNVTVTKDARTTTAEDIDPKAQTEALDFVLLSYVDVKGKVTDAEGNAVEGATVTLTGSISWDVEPLVYTATSDAEGNFTIEGVREDLTYEATAEKDGAVDANWSYQPKADEALTFKLIRLVTVTGTVTDGTGAPIEGARVIFTNTADAADELWLMTDAEGKYSTEEVKEHCTYNVTVSYDGLTDSYEGFSPKLLQVLDFQLIRLVTVTGTVTDTTGAPMEGVRVIFANTADADDGLWLMTDAEGKYSTEEVKEHCTYKVTASKDGITKTVESFDPKTTKVLDFQLTRVVTISDDTEGIAAGTDVTVKFELALEAGHNAIVLPMALTAAETEQIFGSDVEVYTYYDHKDNLARFLLSSDKALEAGVPYMIVSKQAAATATFTGKTLVAEPATVRGEKLHFTGTFAAKEASDGIFALTEDNFVADPTVATYAAAAAEDIKPFRAYITTDDNTVTSVSYTTSDFYSGIEGILVGTDEEPVIYNLHGVRVYNPTPGVYIVNGKKTLLK